MYIHQFDRVLVSNRDGEEIVYNVEAFPRQNRTLGERWTISGEQERLAGLEERGRDITGQN
ncbi:hypothetical protein V8C40DRAFT_242131 [Trichoderma camerunense]